MTTVSEHLRALGFTSGDHDANVREALLELRHARLSLTKMRKGCAWQLTDTACALYEGCDK